MDDFKQQLSDLVDKAVAAGESHDEIIEALNDKITDLEGGSGAGSVGGEPEEYSGLPGEEEAEEAKGD
jgi:hypothetical protein